MNVFNKYLATIFLILIAGSGTFAQSAEGLSDTTAEQDKAGDSIRIAELTQEIQQLKLNEIMYLAELDKTKSAHLSDSIRRARYKAQIDSLRQVSVGAPVVIEGDTLFVFYAARGGVTSMDRAVNAMRNIDALGKSRSVNPDSIFLMKLDNGTQIEIMYGSKVISSVTNDDALWMDIQLDSLAKIKRDAVVQAVIKLQKKYSVLQTIKRVGLFVLIIVMQGIVIYGVNRLHRKLRKRTISRARTRLKPIKIRDYEFLDTKRQTNVLIFSLNIVRWVVILLLLILTVPMLFAIFPQTKHLAMTLFGYIITPLGAILKAVINYIPDLFTVIIICLCIRYLIRGIKFLAVEVETGRLKIPGFYADWAMPTFNIVRFLLYAFMIAMIYPYLPGSDDSIFQGISVFIGLVLSLGGASAISNIISGMVITYMRPFKLGDRIKLNETVGNVIEKSAFVTRLRTPKNEVVTVPNSFIMSSLTTNYSASVREYGLIIHTTVGIGYDTPWQQVHECLIRAAKATQGVMPDREPFVLELEFKDFYAVYQINAYIDDTDSINRIQSDLHTNIQKVFGQEGVSIESPFLMVDRDGTPGKQPSKEKSGERAGSK